MHEQLGAQTNTNESRMNENIISRCERAQDSEDMICVAVASRSLSCQLRLSKIEAQPQALGRL
jgi:hypothetical protein